ncbi:MAG: lipoyl(octanoyl) transferase LipB [Pseudomonadota bacterium]|nr:lipoyl(octanoyl) transferase LipB [Pseudomonadota bacterium]
MAEPTLLIRQLGLRDYEPVWREMQRFTDLRGPESGDELWLVEHPPVFTLGLNGKPEHLLAPGAIPVVAIDRGGQVTYHGPGQQVVYLLLDLKRNRLGIRAVVEKIEQAIIRLLADYAITARSRRDAPGVYVGDSKIAALGLRVRRGCCYHGLALNINMDLEPFTRINPCGYPGMVVTQLADLIDQNSGPADATHIAPALCRYLAEELGYTGTVQP